VSYLATLDALGDSTRWRILERLREGPKAVGELAGTLPVSRPAVSRHLRVLEAAALVTHVSVGARNLYRVDPRGLEALRTWIDGWDAAFAAHVTREVGDPPNPDRGDSDERP